MKKVLPVLTIAFLFTTSANAQVKKGAVLLGGGISGYTQNNDDSDDSKGRGITIAPSVGFVTKDNTVIGFSAGYGRAKSEYDNVPQGSENNFYSAAVFLRKYLSLGKSFYLFGEAGLNYTNSKSEQYNLNSDRIVTKQSGVGFYLYPGIAYAVSKHFHLEASINNLVLLNYQRSERAQTSQGSSSTSESKGFSFDTNVSSNAPLSVGFRFVL